MSYFITPRVTSLYYHYSKEPYICDAFDNTHAPYISDTLRIIRSVFKPQFIHYTEYAKYAFLLLFSIFVTVLRVITPKIAIQSYGSCILQVILIYNTVFPLKIYIGGFHTPSF